MRALPQAEADPIEAGSGLHRGERFALEQVKDTTVALPIEGSNPTIA